MILSISANLFLIERKILIKTFTSLRRENTLLERYAITSKIDKDVIET